jgi:Zn-dependent M16 (insulinase) family peptidase
MTFIEKRVRTIKAMQAVLKEYEHPGSGARHIHLASDDPEMVFLVAFPTVPDKDDGRAHILEHLALCGSGRYPVRDPFFSMLRRSTATYMNAMTYPDRTVYPFASTSPADFFNLLGVYLDAAFFPRLDYLDFLQEGWRHTLEDGKLGYGGVVFNEMKGAFADPMRALGQGLDAVLFQGTTYEVESGGDPLAIPSLTHEDLKNFHGSHYHPSQAVFMTAGAIDPLQVQRVIAEHVLDKLPGRALRLMPELAPKWDQPRETVTRIPSPTARDDEFGIQLAWLGGESADPDAYYRAQLLEAGLVGDASAPLLHAMESAGYGRPSAFNGMDSGHRQLVFHLGMEGLTRQQTVLAREMIWSMLEKTADVGVPHAVLQAALRDLRFSQREIHGGQLPYGMRKLLHALPFEMAGGDIMTAFDSEATLARLEQEIRDPSFFKGLVRELLASPTRLTARVEPDARYFEVRNEIEERRLAERNDAMSDEEAARIAQEAEALLARQRQPVNNDVLPRIRPEDVSPLPRPLPELPAEPGRMLGLRIASNGISYARVMYDVSGLAEDDWPWLDLYAELLADLGVGDMDFAQAASWRKQLAPSFSVDLDAQELLAAGDAASALRIHMVFSSKNVREEQTAIAELLSRSIREARFDESERIAFLIDQIAENQVQDLADQGDQYAIITAELPYSLRRRFQNTVEGADSLRFYSGLARQIESPRGLAAICARLAALHRRVLACPVRIIAAGVEDDGPALAAMIDVPGADPADAAASAPTAERGQPASVALVAPAQVNHCYASWAVPRLGHPDAPVLSVLANLLTNQVLHQALREEGGAYGGTARYAAHSGVFTMLSYRDPRLAGTYEDFKRAIAWAVESPLLREHIEEAIIGVIGELDKPRSPHQEALQAWQLRHAGVTQAMREQFRRGVLECTEAQLKAVARAYLLGAEPSRAAFAGSAAQDLAGLAVVDLMEMVGATG